MQRKDYQKLENKGEAYEKRHCYLFGSDGDARW